MCLLVSQLKEIIIDIKCCNGKLGFNFQSFDGERGYIETVGTRDQLVNSGFAADYMFEQLGEKNKRSGPTEFGDRFDLMRRAYNSYDLRFILGNEARVPYGMGHIDP